MSIELLDLLPAFTALAMIALVVWNGVSTARTVAALRGQRERERDRERDR